MDRNRIMMSCVGRKWTAHHKQAMPGQARAGQGTSRMKSSNVSSPSNDSSIADHNIFAPVSEDETLLSKESKKSRRVKFCKKVWVHTKANMLLLLTIIAVVIGAVLGLAIKPANPSTNTIELIAFPGELFLRALKMLILPLIVFSLIAGLGSLDIKVAGVVGIRTILYYGVTTILAVSLGLILVLIIKPGNVSSIDTPCDNHTISESQQPIDTLDSVLDLMRNMIPDNIFTATYSQDHTEYYMMADWNKCFEANGLNFTNITKNSSELFNDHCAIIKDELTERGLIDSCNVTRAKQTISRSGMNILGIITFTVAFSLALSSLGRAGKDIVRTIAVLNEAIMKLVMAVMWTSPVGIASIIAGKLLEVDSFKDLVEGLGMYFLCVVLGLILHSFITLPLIYIIITRRNPLKLVKGALQALLIAFGTSSSSATLPVTIRCLEDNLGFDTRVTRFMLPIGATINMDGTALYEAIAAVFLAQLAGVGGDPFKIVVIALTATLASIGAAGVPQAGLVTLIIVLTAIGLPAEDAALILAVDWLLDRIRTTVNVFGDCVGVGIVNHLSRKQLQKFSTTANVTQQPLSNDMEISITTTSDETASDPAIQARPDSPPTSSSTPLSLLNTNSKKSESKL